MFLSYLSVAFYASLILCVDIEITGDLTFDLKIRNYRQRAGVEVDIPLRLSIGNSGTKQKEWPYGNRERIPRVGKEITTSSQLTPAELPVTAENKSEVTSMEEIHRLRDELDEPNNRNSGLGLGQGAEEGAGEGKRDLRIQSESPKKKQKSLTTMPTPIECPYRYPEPWEANAVLSNMMNKLTKLFVMMSRSLYENVRPRSSAEAARLRRFKIISKYSHDYFDRIFANMSTEFRMMYNATRERLMRADDGDEGGGGGGGGGGRCARQADVGRAWRRLLELAQDTYRAAALRCVDVQLSPWLASRDGSMQTHLNSALSSVNKQLLKDLERIRSEQLRVLCKLYQLC